MLRNEASLEMKIRFFTSSWFVQNDRRFAQKLFQLIFLQFAVQCGDSHVE